MKKKTLLMSVSAFALLCGIASCGHEHEFGSTWEKDATHHWHAAVCDHAEEVADKAAHTWDAGKVTKEATEEAKGEKTFTCTVCDATKTEEIAQLAHTHKFGTEWSKDATHHWHASTCGHADQVDSKAEHTWDAGTVTKQPTYAAAGEKTYECTVCDASKTEAVAKLESKLVLNAADLEVGDIAAGTIQEQGGFKLITDNPAQDASKIDKVLSVTDDVNVTIGEETFTQRIKTNGSSNTTVGSEERVISFTTTGKGTVKVYAKHGSSDESKPAAKLSVTHKEKGIGHDAVEIAVGADAAVYELELHYAGEFYISSTQNISIYKIEVEWQDGVNEDWVPPIVVSDPNTLNVSELTAQAFEKDTVIGNFVVNAGAKADKQDVVIDGNSKTFDGVSYTQRLKLGGLGTEDYRSVTINVTEASTIRIIVTSSNGDAARTANLFKVGGAAVADVDANIPGSNSGLVELIYDVTEAGSYNFRVTGGDGGANIYAIYVEEGVSEPEPEPTPDPTPEPNPGTFEGFTLDYAALLTELGGTVADKAAIAENSAQLSALGLLDLTGPNTVRYSDSKGLYAIEIAKKGTGSVTFTAPTDIVLTIGVASTGSSNTSTYAVMVNDAYIASNENPDVTVSEVTGTSAVTVTYNIAAGSVVKILSPESSYNRGFRLMSLSIALQS